MSNFPLSKLEAKAWDFAREKHEGQFRKFIKSSYFDGHLSKVNGLVKQYNTNERILCASILHDCLEDTDTTYQEIVEEFGIEVADLVMELTSKEDMIETMGKSDYLLDKMSTMSDDALIIKLCDRLQNISDSYTASERFRSNYYKETRYIIDRLSDVRQLNVTHRRIVEQINGLLDNIKTRYQYESLTHIKRFNFFNI